VHTTNVCAAKMYLARIDVFSEDSTYRSPHISIAKKYHYIKVLKLKRYAIIRIAHLLGGNENDVKVGTFVGYNHELGVQDSGFQKNLDLLAQVFSRIVGYAEDMGVTVLYENCPMEGWMPATTPTTYNNLPATLAARKLMYTLIPSMAHGETYDPSHDAWQGVNPSEVLMASDMGRVHRIHIKGTRNLNNNARLHWGSLYPMQAVDPKLAERAGVPTCQHEWDRHHYEPMMPGFGGSDSIDWRAFTMTARELGYAGPLVMENEATNSKGTGNMGATMQGFKAGVFCLAPMVWTLGNDGYQFSGQQRPLADAATKDVPLVTMKNLGA